MKSVVFAGGPKYTSMYVVCNHTWEMRWYQNWDLAMTRTWKVMRLACSRRRPHTRRLGSPNRCQYRVCEVFPGSAAFTTPSALYRSWHQKVWGGRDIHYVSQSGQLDRTSGSGFSNYQAHLAVAHDCRAWPEGGSWPLVVEGRGDPPGLQLRWGIVSIISQSEVRVIRLDQSGSSLPWSSCRGRGWCGAAGGCRPPGSSGPGRGTGSPGTWSGCAG